MNKKVMAIAVAGVLAAPAAFAQTSNVQLYGRAVVGFDNYRATGARDQGAVSGGQIDYNSRNRVFDNSSRVGLRGTEDLGNGLKAIFQIETGVAVDSGQAQGSGGQANASKGTWASRDSFAGIDSNFGRLTFGRQSIYWANGTIAQRSANYINQEVPWENGTNLGRISRNRAGAPVSVARQSNTVQYTTPTFAGLNATISYSPNAQEGVQHNNTQNTDGQVWGATARGNWGPIAAQFDWAQNKGNTPLPTGTQAKWTGYKAGAAWTYMPGSQIGLTWVRSENNNVLGLVGDNKVKQDGWTFGWEHTFGNVQVMAEYGQTGDMKNCDNLAGSISCSDTKSKAWMAGARYFLSKRTWVFASYNQVTNKANNFADLNGDAYSSAYIGNGATLVPYGADPRVWAVGLFHAF